MCKMSFLFAATYDGKVNIQEQNSAHRRDEFELNECGEIYGIKQPELKKHGFGIIEVVNNIAKIVTSGFEHK